MSTSTKIASLTIEDTGFPLLTPTIINQELIEKNGNFIPFDRLAQLRVALDALQPVPPNANTVWFDDTILLQDASGTGDSLTINPTSITSNGNLEIDCQSGIIDAKGQNITLTNLNGGGAIIFLDDVVDNIQMSVEASAGNTGLFTNDNLSFQCKNMNTRVSQGTSVLASDTNLIEFQITEDVNNSILRFTAEDPSAIIESNNNLTIRSSSNLILQTPENIQVECPNGYITHQSGKMARTEEIRVTVGSYLEPNANFFTTNNQNVKLYRVGKYFNPLTPKQDGWYCYLFNYDASVDLTSDDGKTIIGRRSGPNVIYPISGSSTQRISLVWVDSLGDYVWSVSDF